MAKMAVSQNTAEVFCLDLPPSENISLSLNILHETFTNVQTITETHLAI
jgi:hypothetical protein